MTYGYIRVSTDKQTVENQRFEITKFCERNNLSVDGWIEETISGTKSYTKRELGKLLNKVKKDDLIICAELSRLGRNLFMIMEILNICMTKECRVWTIKDNYRLGDDIQSKVLAFAFGLSAEIERNLISQRTKEALARKRAMGIVPGCKKGAVHTKHKCDVYADEIQRLLDSGYSFSQIAKRIGVNRETVSKYVQKLHPEKFSFDIAQRSSLAPYSAFVEQLHNMEFSITQIAKIIHCSPITLRKYYAIEGFVENEELNSCPVHSHSSVRYLAEQYEIVRQRKLGKMKMWQNFEEYERQEKTGALNSAEVQSRD